MKIVLRPHLKIRLKQREIPQSYPEKILKKPDSKYHDQKTNHNIAIKELEYAGRLRPMVVAYDIIDLIIEVITVYPTEQKEIDNKIIAKRWLEI